MSSLGIWGAATGVAGVLVGFGFSFLVNINLISLLDSFCDSFIQEGGSSEGSSRKSAIPSSI